MQRFALLLVSHTNVGKTATARTLLGRDVGEVRDAAHVTQSAQAHELISTAEGDRLDLWDTPGFGDSVRLERRLRHLGDPIGWFLTEVWDRFRDRAFWSTQKALRAVVDEADVVLFLVDASGVPEPGGPFEAELRLLARLGKPVLMLLNQLGVPRGPQADAEEVRLWQQRAAAAAPGCVRTVLAFDAFARCWVQEAVLMRAIAAVLPAGQRAAFDRVQAAWMGRHRAVHAACMSLLARHVVEAALDSEPVQPPELRDRLKQGLDSVLGRASTAGAAGDAAGPELDAAERLAHGALVRRQQARLRSATDAMIRLHGLDGSATEAVMRRMAAGFDLQRPLSEGRAAVVGGTLATTVAGAVAGLKVDLASGGFTLGAGLLAGALLGAAGGAGLARRWNQLRGRQQAQITWAEQALELALQDGLLHYLAVAHYGRGRGEWRDAEHPPIWPPLVRDCLDRRRVAWLTWTTQWRAAQEGRSPEASTRQSLVDGLQPLVEAVGMDLLGRLYPGALDGDPGHGSRGPKPEGRA